MTPYFFQKTTATLIARDNKNNTNREELQTIAYVLYNKKAETERKIQLKLIQI